MKQFFDFLNSVDEMCAISIGGIQVIKHWHNQEPETTGVIFCQPIHFQPLVDLGVKIDFSDKKVDFAYNQKTVGGSGNTCAIKCRIPLSVYEKINIYFRKDYRLNMQNNHNLKNLNFPFSNRILNKI